MIVSCPHCGKGWRVNAKLAGKQATCAACKKAFTIPAAPTEPARTKKTPQVPPPPTGVSLTKPTARPAAPADVSKPRAPAAAGPKKTVGPTVPPPLPSTPGGATRPGAIPPPIPHAPASAALQTLGVKPGLNKEFFASIKSPSLVNYGQRVGFFVGIVLAVSFFLPILVPKPGWESVDYKLYFPHIQGLWWPLPGSLRFLLFYPLPAGIAMILLAIYARGYIRPLGILGIALLPLIVSLGSDSGFTSDALVADSNIPAEDMQGTSIPFVAMFSLIGLFIGLRIQRGKPESAFGRVFAAICGGLFLLLLIIPSLPRQLGTMLIVTPFKLMEIVNPLTGIGVLMLLVALAGVAVIGCINFRYEAERNVRLASMGIQVLFVTVIAVPLALAIVLVVPLIRLDAISAPMIVIMPLLNAVKFETLIWGSLGCIVVGSIDLYATLPEGWFNKVKQWSSGLQQQTTQQAPFHESANVVQQTPSISPPKRTDSDRQPDRLLELRAKLKQLQELKEEGLISNGDFEARKKVILDKLTED